MENRTDNAAVVAIVNSGRTKMPLAMHFMRSLFSSWPTLAYVSIFTVHLPGRHSEAADALSRDDSTFFWQVPSVCRDPEPVPLKLQELLVSNQPDWTSANWTSRLHSSLQRD